MQRRRALQLFGGALALWASGCGDDVAPVPKSCGNSSTVTRFGSTIYVPDDIDTALRLIVDCGGTLVRVGLDEYFIHHTDAVVAKAAQYGLRVVLISPYSAQPVNRTSYAQQCVAIHRRYAEHNPVWEIWNEPNLAAYWGTAPSVSDYGRLAVEAATALRANGATDIWTGGTSGIDVRWSYALLQQGVYDTLNGCAVHSYKDPGAASGEYVALQKLLPSHVQIHTTETCIASNQGDQSAFLSGMWYIHRALGLPTMIWCELRDFTAGANPPYNYPYGLLWSTYRPKDAYYTAKSLTSSCD